MLLLKTAAECCREAAGEQMYLSDISKNTHHTFFESTCKGVVLRLPAVHHTTLKNDIKTNKYIQFFFSGMTHVPHLSGEHNLSE